MVWHENGQKMQKVFWVNGKTNGLTTNWYENGQMEAEVNFKDGKEDGPFTCWYDDGGRKKKETTKTAN